MLSATLQKGVFKLLVGGCRCASGPRAFCRSWSGFPVLGGVSFFLFSPAFLPFCFKRKGGDPETDQLFLEDLQILQLGTVQRTRTLLRYPQQRRRTSTAKCSLKVSSWPDPVHRGGSEHRERAVVLLRDGCYGWRPPDSGAASNWRRTTKAASHNPSLSVARGVLGLRFAPPETSRRHFLRAVAAAVSSSTSLRRLRLRVAAQASKTPHCDVSAPPDVEASCITSVAAGVSLSLPVLPCFFLWDLFFLYVFRRRGDDPKTDLQTAIPPYALGTCV